MKTGQHKNRFFRVVFISCLVLLSLGTAGAAPSDLEQKLRALDAEWSAAAAAGDLDKTVSYYSDDAVLLAPNAPLAKTKKAIRAIWKKELTGVVRSGWKPTRVEIAQSGELAYLSGTYEWVGKDASGKTVKDHGKYLEVWKKQADGSWKCDADAWNSDLPASP